MTAFPERKNGVFYLSEGGQETELMYRHGHDLPEFAMYPLLDNPSAVADLTRMYRRVLDVAVRYAFVPMISGLDYRASPDWGEKLGYSRAGLAEALERSIAFLQDVAAPYRSDAPGLLIGGAVGPRGDAYSVNRTITADEAEDYHSFQLDILKRTGVDYALAMTFTSVPEAVGVARAAARIGVPLGISFMLGSDYRLDSGRSLKEAVIMVDEQAGAAKPAYYGVNCSHPLEFEPALEQAPWMDRVRSLRPNASAKDKIELCSIGHLEDGDPAELGQQVTAIARRFPSVDILGGCCGTWDRHLDQIAQGIRAM